MAKQPNQKPYDVLFMERRIDRLVKHIEDIKAQEKSDLNRALVIRAKENIHSLRLWVKDRMRIEPTIQREREDRKLQEYLLNFESSQSLEEMQILGRINRKSQPRIAVVLNVVDKMSGVIDRMLGKTSFTNMYKEMQQRMGVPAHMLGPFTPPAPEKPKREQRVDMLKDLVKGSDTLKTVVQSLAQSAAQTIQHIQHMVDTFAKMDPTLFIKAGYASYCSDPDDEQPGESVIQSHL